MDTEQSKGNAKRRSSRNPTVNRERILTAARKLFTAQGVAATSMNQISQEAQVGAGTLYRHFAHKGKLCEALMWDDFAAFQERICDVINGPDAPESALTRLDHLLVEIISLTLAHIPMLTAMQESGAGHQHTYQGPIYSWVHQQLTSVLTAAAARSEVINLDVEFTADAILALIAPPLLAFQQQQRGFSPTRITDGVRRLFIDGLQQTDQAV